MPHVFLLFESHPSSKTCYSELAKFITAVSTGQKLETRMEVVNGKGIIEPQPLELEKFPTTYTKEEVLSKLIFCLMIAHQANGSSGSGTESHQVMQ